MEVCGGRNDFTRDWACIKWRCVEGGMTLHGIGHALSTTGRNNRELKPSKLPAEACLDNSVRNLPNDRLVMFLPHVICLVINH